MNIRVKLMCVILTLTMVLAACNSQSAENNVNQTPYPTVIPEVTKIPTKKPEGAPKATAASKQKTDSKEASNIKDKEEEYLVVKITHVDYAYFMAEAPWQSSIKYIIHAELGDKYCEGDYVEVVYKDIYELENNQYEVDALEVTASNYVSQGDVDYKPVIYLYPKKEMKVDVRLDYSGAITVSSPEYKDGWVVTAKPDGTLIGDDGEKYPYIFWEGIREMSYDLNEGFCVEGSKTKEFLQEKLKYMGLTDSETRDFIKFWTPYMQGNAYNLISFQGTAYTDHAKLKITPKPDSILRIYMVFKPLKQAVDVKEQVLKRFDRKGFAVVEWGGTIQ